MCFSFIIVEFLRLVDIKTPLAEPDSDRAGVFITLLVEFDKPG
jgi:hypothetical protein